MANTYSKYEDKQDLNVDAGIPRKNKCIAEDLNFLKYQTPNTEATSDTKYAVNMTSGKNLFDKNSIIGYSEIDSNGKIVSDLSYCVSQFIEIQPATQYTFSCAGTVSSTIAQYDKNKNFIEEDTEDVGGGFTVRTKASARYIRISLPQTIPVLSFYQIEKGSSATTYEDFATNTTIVNDKTYSESSNVNENYDPTKRVNFKKSRNLFNLNDYKYINAGFNAGAVNYFVLNSNATTIYIPCKPSQPYTIKKFSGTNLFIGCCSQTPAENVSITNNKGSSTTNEETIITSRDAKYLVVLLHTVGIDEITLQQALNGLMIEEGLTSNDYEPYTTNSIQVDNETFTETLKVGTEVDEKSRVNVLYSPNLFDKNNILVGYYIDASGNLVQDSGNFISDYIKLKQTDYFTNVATTNQPIRVAYFNSSKTFISRELIYGSGALTIPNNTAYVKISTYNTELDSLMINEGNEELPYEPYVVPSINVDGETIYQLPVVLWTNPSPTSSFAGQEITLSDNLSNYSYYEVLWLFASTVASIQLSTGKIEVGKLPFLGTLSTVSGALAGYRRLADSISDTSITFGNGTRITTSGTTDNSVCIPYKILGYK